MRKAVDYTDQTRDGIIAEQGVLGFRLVEEQRHFDGNHLVFVNDEPEPIPEPRDLAAEIDEIKAELKEKGII